MGNLFAGLSSGSSALSYYMRGIETAGHNVANATTEGYSRQRVNASAATPVTTGGLTVGNGVQVDSITRIRDMFLDAQYRTQLPELGYLETKAANIKNLEYYSGEADRTTFLNSMNNYWTHLEDLHIYPEASTSRRSLIESTKSMITSMSNMRTAYDQYRSDLNQQVSDMVQEANSLIDQIALLCKDIAQAQALGQNPNDLLDERDLLAERLCKLTGARVGSPTLDESDGDYKIDLNGKLLVQGGAQLNCKGTAIINTRYLVLVPMVGNLGYYDVQVEGNQYDHSSDYNVASVIVERGATDPASCSKSGNHELFVERLANGKTWTVGGATGYLAGGDRLDTIYSKTQALGIEGSFSLQVGTAGVMVRSKSYIDLTNPAMNGIAVTKPVGSEQTSYEFRIAAGEFETYVKLDYDSVNDNWKITTDGGETLLYETSGGDLMVEDIYRGLSEYPNFAATFDANTQTFTLEAANTDDMRGHLLSITDIKGTLAADLEIANKNPAVEITITKDDTLTTIANKINSAYKSELVSGDNAAYSTNPPETAPSSPEEWLHASVQMEPNGTYYIALTSNVAGEANRINVLPGNVCGVNGDLSVARLLGFVEKNANQTSYIQIDADPDAKTTIIKDDVHVNDAYFIYNGRHYLSESNSFAEARIFKTTNSQGKVISWDNPAADTLDRFANGIRLNLNGLNHFYDDVGNLTGNEPTIIRIDPHLTTGEIYAMLECRDDMILGFEDYFDKLVFEMVTEVNATHYAGYGIGDSQDTTGTAYFVNVNARYGASKNFYLNAELEKDLSLIATGSGDGTGHTKGCGDGTNILNVAQLKSTKVFEGGSMDFNTFFMSFVSDLGSQGYQTNYLLVAQQSIADQINTMRDAVSGVSTDEEMIDIIKFQQGVGAVARYMTALDEMLDKIINGMGVN